MTFLARMQLDPTGPDRWSAGSGGPDGVARGVLAAQAMVAAGRSVDTRWRWVHAVHVTHLGEGEPAAPVRHHVERVHDTDHGAVRLVRSAQGGSPLALTTVTFATPRKGRGPTHQDLPAIDDLPDPHALPATVTAGALDVRHVDRPRWERAATPTARNRMWMRFTEELPDEILLHAAALVRAADLLLVEPVAPPPAGEWTDLETGRGLRTVALDLSARFHRGFRADDWVLHEHESPSAADYRAFTTGRFLSSMGRLVATVSQETALLPVAEHAPAAFSSAALPSAAPRTPEDG